MDIEKAIKEKKIPSWEELSHSFDLTEDAKSLIEVRKMIAEHLEGYIKYLEELLHPEQSLASLYECKLFDDEEKQTIFTLFKRLMFIHRRALELSLENGEDADISFINEAFTDWKAVKGQLKGIISRVKQSWKDPDVDISDMPEYFG
ncbi:MAG: hypothetical protein ABIH34_07175 [Nanoarchaeota archaeon]